MSWEYWVDEGVGISDGGEVVVVEDVVICGDEILFIVVIFGGGSLVVVGMDEFVLNVFGVELVVDEIWIDGCEDELDVVDCFVVLYGEYLLV